MRQNNDWLFTKYDVFNRPVMTGKHHHDMEMTQEQMQDEVNLPNYLLFEHYIGGEGYSNDAFPEITEHDEVLTLTYYDNYNALELEEEEPSPYTFLPTDLPFYFLENGTYSGKTKGLTTITKTKVLLHDGLQVADDWLLSVTYYDKYQHPIQTITDNHLGGVTVFSSQINFTGQVEETKEQVIVPGETNVIRQQTTYDHAGRLKETKHKINDQDWVTLSRHKYNETGQLTLKKLHGGGNNFLEQITYKYNIRGWLTGINDMEHPGENRFVMQLDYNQAETPRYNGNIGSMSWQSAHFATPKQYHFSYDNANRLLTATYADAGKYTTHYTYDKNGNIKNLTRMGELGGSNTYGYIDQLTYAYTGNQLKYVNDNTGDNHQNNGFTDNGSLLTTNEYFYDLNGNLTCDLNKQINHIEYNYLNLPRRIDLSGANLNTINYLYSANGVKLQKNTSIAYGRSAPTDYLGTIVYPGEAPAYIFTPEGRALRNDQGNFDYEYFLKDHLGNTRVSFNQKGTILQDNSYYPFGMGLGEALTYVDNATTENKYLYNGKEMQDDFGLGWYDYGARMYDGELGRWHVVDPLAENSISMSPYHFVANNPLVFIDLNGMDWFYYKAEGDEDPDWHYQEGKSYNTGVKNDNGEDIIIQGVESIVKYTITGKNEEGSWEGTVDVYNQDKKVHSQDGVFTGSGQYSGTQPADKGTYWMEMHNRDYDGPNKFTGDNGEPDWFLGAQLIPDKGIGIWERLDGTSVRAYNDHVVRAYGNGRIRLNPSDEVRRMNALKYGPGREDRGLYLHGKKDEHNWTHGCVCDKKETVFKYLWNNVHTKTPFVIYYKLKK